MRHFKFLTKLFNPREYDFEGFTFIGVSTIHRNISDNRPYRIMVYMDNRTHTPVLANRIWEHEEPYNIADVIQVIDNRIYQLPRTEGEYINVTLTWTPNETI